MNCDQPYRSAALSLRRITARHVTGLIATLLFHWLLLTYWEQARTPLPGDPYGPPAVIQWIDLPAVAPQATVAATVPRRPVRPRPARPASAPAIAAQASIAPAPAFENASPPAPSPQAIEPAPAPSPASAPAPAPASASAPSAATIREQALHSAGAVDRALRRENRPYIVAPPDSAQIRMRRGMERAHDTAPPALWQAPVVEALVNQTGDGARRERVITGRRT
jgi:hypothetical protein